jgi:hypothetical protein
MPVSALFLLMMGAGGFLVYAAVKGEHPWQLFTNTVKGASGNVPVATGSASAPAATPGGNATSGPSVATPGGAVHP